MDDAEDLRAIWQSVLHMQQITEDVLDHTKLSAGKLAVRRSTVVVKELLQQLITDKDRAAVPITLRISTSVPVDIWSDRLRLLQILRNGLNNAVKYSRGHDPVVLSVKRVGGTNSIVPALRFEIRNKGYGLQVANPSTLFEPFDQDPTGMFGPVRLGLPICRYGARCCCRGRVVARCHGAVFRFASLRCSFDQRVCCM